VGEEHGWRLGRIEDPFGHHWEIGTPLIAWPPAHRRPPDRGPRPAQVQSSLTDEELVGVLQRYLTILQRHPNRRPVRTGIDGLRDFLSQRGGFFDERHTIDAAARPRPGGRRASRHGPDCAAGTRRPPKAWSSRARASTPGESAESGMSGGSPGRWSSDSRTSTRTPSACLPRRKRGSIADRAQRPPRFSHPALMARSGSRSSPGPHNRAPRRSGRTDRRR
jgi:hypothetical protein